MPTLLQLLGENLAGLDPTRLVPMLVLASVFLLSYAGLRTFQLRAEIRRRAAAASLTESSKAASRAARAEATQDILARVGKFLAPTDAASYSQARLEMVRAGFFTPAAVPVFHATRIILGFGLPMAFLAMLSILPTGLSGVLVLVLTICLSALGFIAPSFYVQHRQRVMRTLYRSGFPDFMDLLLVCVESGLALQLAIARISREIATTYPQLAVNLHLVSLELRAGSTLAAALDNMTQRLNIEEAASLASLLKQSEELGTSLGTALRVYSDEMRDKRYMRAESLAQALPVKIVIPVGFCIFPVILVILFLPLFIRIKQIFLL